MGVFFAASNAAPELVKLGESEVFCVFDDHDGGVGDVYADFDDGGADEYLNLVIGELFHDVFFFFGFHASV